MNGQLITFEGVEGSGKTSMVESLSAYLKSQGKKVITTKEPGGTIFGEHLRDILKKENYDISPMTQLYLFLADRQDHVEKVLKPFLEDGYIVICDRYVESTIVYQGIGMNLIEEMNKISLDFGNIVINLQYPPPNLTFLLDIDPEISLKRLKREEDKDDNFHKLDIEFHKKIRKGYLELANLEFYKRLKIIDASKDVIEVFKDILEIWEEYNNE